MFEKLKEYGLYIVLSLIALGALAYAFLSTSNAQKGGEVVSKIQDELVTAIAKNQKVKDKTTIVDHFGDINGLTIGSYKLNTTKVLFLNTDGDTVATSDTISAVPTSAAGELNLVMLPNKAIGGASSSYELLTKSAGGVAHNAADGAFKAINEQARGFLATGYVGFGTFGTKSDAKEFRDSYFSTGMIACKTNSTTDTASDCVVLIEIAR